MADNYFLSEEWLKLANQLKDSKITYKEISNALKKSKILIEKEPVKRGYWLRKNGELIKISDMDDNHIRNAIRLLKRNNVNKEKILELEEELNSRFKKDDYDEPNIVGAL